MKPEVRIYSKAAMRFYVVAIFALFMITCACLAMMHARGAKVAAVTLGTNGLILFIVLVRQMIRGNFSKLDSVTERVNVDDTADGEHTSSAPTNTLVRDVRDPFGSAKARRLICASLALLSCATMLYIGDTYIRQVDAKSILFYFCGWIGVLMSALLVVRQ